MTDSQIIQGCQRYQPKAQRALVDKYSPYLMAICRRYMSDDSSAKDALQDSLIHILHKMDKYDTRGSLKSWMATITVRKNLEIIRKADIRSRAEAEANRAYDVHNTAPIKMESDTVINFIQQLPHSTRIAVSMFLIEGYSHKEIADTLDISEGTSRSLVSRGRQLIKNTFAEIERPLPKKTRHLRIAL